MSDLFELSLFPLVLTLAAFRLGQFCQKKGKLPLFNPTLLAALFILCLILLTGMDLGTYTSGGKLISWLMTPATISLAIPVYEQFQLLRKDLKAIAAGVTAGTLSSLTVLLLGSMLFGLDKVLTVSLLPKSVTTAIGIVLSQGQGGLGGVTTAAIIVTGILANMAGPALCRLFRITDPIAQGTAYGTAGHVIGTAKANELSPLIGAVSSLSLVTAGLLTAILFPLFTRFL